MLLVAVIAVALVALAAAGAFAALREPGLRRSENLEQIDAYGYASRTELAVVDGGSARRTLDSVAAALGTAVARRVRGLREDEIQRELISAGYFGVGPRRFLGYRALITISLPLALVVVFDLLGTSALLLLVLGVVGVVSGWMGPTFVLHRRARSRLEQIDAALPEMIDLLTVTLEAGAGFLAALRMASERIEGPLGDELRLTVQEQTLGLSTLLALENWLRRCDTASVRSFVRAMVQGDRLGVSIGQILRNQAVEMRARRKQVIEEQAQKAPIKILFPLVFLIFPAMFVIILGPALFEISKGLK